jgi:hypothetical protein
MNGFPGLSARLRAISSGVGRGLARFNPSETGFTNHLIEVATSFLEGSLIQATVGSAGGSGRLWTNLKHSDVVR